MNQVLETKKDNNRKKEKNVIGVVTVISLIICFSCIMILYFILSNKEKIKIEIPDLEKQITEQTANIKVLETNTIIPSSEIEEEQQAQETDETKQTDKQYTSSQDKTGINTETRTNSAGEKYSEIASLSIPSLNIKYPVLSKTSDTLLKISLNKYWGGEPNEVGNFCIVGHNYKNKTHFGKLPQIQKGATVNLTDTTGRTISYEVYDTYKVDPYDTKCTSQLTNGKKEVTLITCVEYGKKRLVVKAREKI